MKKEKILSATSAIGITEVVAFLFAKLSADVFEVYGSGVFLATPFVCGLISVWIYNRKGKKRIGESISVSFIAGCISLLGFLVVGFEGLICLAMAIPVVLPLFLIGGLVGYAISNAIGKRIVTDVAVLLLVFSVPFLMGFESQEKNEPRIRKAITTVEIDAPIGEVWREVIQFSEIPEPREFLFRIGIAYPTDARIEGSGVGAIRYCNFSTGSFVEPITHWEENRKLAFDVIEQPEPMTEISPYSGIHPPHLDWAIRSVKGQFLLKEREDGIVELEGTTWFYTVMEPEPYWSAITEEMIHLIHMRVLEHIKTTVESGANQAMVSTPLRAPRFTP